MTNSHKSVPSPAKNGFGDPHRGPLAASFALETQHQQPLFLSETTVRIFEEALTDQARRHGCEAVVYLFLPNRCEVLLRGRENASDVFGAFDSFRRQTREWLQKNRPDVDWSTDLQDCIVRRPEEIATQIESILEIPVRQGMVKQWREYRFKGSTIFDLDTWLYPI